MAIYDDFISNMPEEELAREYKVLAKRANNRLRAIEGYSYDRFFKGMKKFAYRNAMYDIKNMRGEGYKRFSEKAPQGKYQLIKSIQKINRFLEAPSSAKRSLTEVYIAKVDTINKKFGTSFTWKEFAIFIESDFAKTLSEQYGSKTRFKIIAEVPIKDINKKIVEYNKKNKVADSIELEKLNDFLKSEKNKTELESLLNDLGYKNDSK